MRYFKIRVCALFVLLAALAFTATFFLLHEERAAAEAPAGYYYQQLGDEAKGLYRAIDDMQSQGLLKTGNAELDLIGGGYVSEAQCATVALSSDFAVAFGAARDAYSLDHPEIFYIDFTYLSFSVGTKDGSYVATLGTGRGESYYIEDGFQSAEEIDGAVEEFNAAVDAIVQTAQHEETDAERVAFVNKSLTERIEYSFCATATAEGTVYEEGAAHIRSAYGALVNGKAVCEGYARAFKVVMDELGIECVLVQGYAQGEGGGLEAHMWNYVKLGGFWYGVDVTWNDSVGETEYLLRGNAFLRAEHIPDGVVSESGFSFRYPDLHPYDYGVSVDANGMTIEGEYQTTDSDVTTLIFTVSYNGKGAVRLAEEDGLYMVYRYGIPENGEVVWQNWIYFGATPGYDYGTYSVTPVNTYVQYVQFAMIDYAPDDALHIQYVNEVGEGHISAISEPHVNEAYGTYAAPPYVKTITPANTSTIQVTRSYRVTVTYTEALKKANEDLPVGIYFTSQHADIAEYAAAEDFTWSSDTISFTFTPSQMFNHRYELYSFYPVNLVGEESGKEPNAFSLLTEQTSVACSRVYGDGRLYIKSYGQPSLVSAGDLSLTGWTDENGEYVSQNQRSQLMLVVSTPNAAQSEEMLEGALSVSGASEEAVLASSTYELELDLCSHIINIPSGSYMQVAFGFPEGYGPDDAGVTFKVYHFKRGEDGEIDYSQTEELECVVTEYGLIVTVTDFSPFAVVAYQGSALAASGKKGVYARVVGFGGSVAEGIVTVGENESVTLTLKPEAGYRVDRVLLNGEAISVNGNTVELAYAQLAENNTVTVSFVSERVAEREAEEGITHIYPCVELSRTAEGSGTEDGGAPKDESIRILSIVLIVVIIVCLAGLVAFLLVYQKRKGRKR